ncbi:16S rRNA (uracil(1498)-N(3))-methyltransferase [Pseudoalteromonas sp. McH1-7]|uniref:Ribosomal RNA small subunit methyltransferase E n=1 Tax=Pseudoalteromonas peptidolytica F12-50-A1 TaxID=1315280 RepID=A0A8I0MWZ1_9GAMM|nr:MULTISPECIES: 16S rRNA (uracil(1498)-N(3))-methyltransferase [Pseudoalteromonas]MBE0347469.1 16S rRNA (uracil1498-N3)-methyltransferase [Pseudoalteromonas peptidolytica F12-50-A1]NLR13229.1 16S rRNA (uracil(1498)-N(3))-methyltransferase [Pseudoalteromonas peptidolytica]NUZ12476.1 16S rRNA (uracil(1498)-N(3))-methyltransferase [Pseudoalteromonas sp. McH1-7]USD30128.1 16S rRNA (uracil(1498)-N(3))-methyltransferase [Pseudoalteromonas sp. SCSIO 43201]GEK07841.1 ribosomal RNA small subunit methy
MRIPHIYQDSPLEIGIPVTLDDDAAGHIGRVLRMTTKDKVSLFNGQGGEYLCHLSEVSKKKVIAVPETFQDNNVESPLAIHLGQGISRGDKMDFTIQKSVELGVSEITPLFTTRCGVKLNAERLAKKHQQWQKIAIAAAEQSGRNTITVIHPPIELSQWLKQHSDELKVTLHPRAEHSIKTLPYTQSGIRFLVGPEGGFTDEELVATAEQGFIDVRLGPRVLRTETAALTVLSALQLQFGDLAL